MLSGSDGRASPALRFGLAGGEYDAGRPSYPPAAVAWAVGAGRPRVVDVGAGTGKLTRALLESGAEVVAVEPDPTMRSRCTESLPGVPVRAGTAESLPLPDRSVDVVAVGHAYHWFDRTAALREFARVLRPAGRLVLMWNLRTELHGWEAEFTRLIAGQDSVRRNPLSGMGEIGPPFSPFEEKDVPHTQQLTPDQLVALAASRSHVIGLPPAERADVLRGVRAVARSAARDGTVTLHYVTRCWRSCVAPP
ncbi:class I SAM-dependent methyltransferase [Streptomyces sp. SP18CS02]|uniref:class I SAM-dependent methyltransferase n=1 Tax=Streptomyces sp. SP18CS02 TaxID=3002531 RepID=UPI002E78AF95|nr:class I SAM-dependent methyltransferase [Streptomyces sp. SP18CS02]MEE1752744.1 class I SAM-dependent methyltransferase [Streptomyces sp. SP18CS02]